MLESIIVVLGIVIDQVTKIWSEAVLANMPNATIPLIPNVFELTYVQNRGAAFGMLQGRKFLFIILTLVTVGVLLYLMIKNRNTYSIFMRISLAMILSGAIGNFIDRLVLSYVRDMFYFKLINFAVFNVADALISVGAVGLVVCVLFFDGMGDKAKAEQEKAELEQKKKTDALINAGGMDDSADYSDGDGDGGDGD